MDAYKIHRTVWRVGIKLLRPFFEHKFHYTHEDYAAEKPCVVVANHVTNWDPLLMAVSFAKHHMYFVASEHLFRKGYLSKLINFLAGPIARKKGSSGVDTAMACLRHIRRGHSVCVFGEGEVTWDGLSKPVFPGTGMLAKMSGATLVTYRLEGGCLTRPRWATTIRKGKMHGSIVGIYEPETLKSMSNDEVTELINRDIFENTWERQAAQQIPYKGRKLANRIESALFLCPECKQIGTLNGHGTTVSCTCGFKTQYTPLGVFNPPAPFQHIGQWDAWQHQCLKNGDFVQKTPLFSDCRVKLYEILDDHASKELLTAPVTLDHHVIQCGSMRFDLEQISSMAIVQTNILLFTHDSHYYELRGLDIINFRKYLALWQNLQEAKNHRTGD